MSSDVENTDVEAQENVETPEKLVLRTDNLVKKYGRRTVVNHVSINVTQGEIVGLLGPQRGRKDHNLLYDCRPYNS